uniref:SEA domain-containing protein n=1 Tax=Romanomermis culicivorax TaxID=13658 RepID=A0A915HMG2_ROMCU
MTDCKEGYYDEDIYRPGTKCVKEQKCGDKYCDRKAGFICDAKTSKCVCSRDDQQPRDGKCIDVVPIDLYLWVVRRNQNIYIYGPDFGNLNSAGTREIVNMFTDGVGKVYAGIPLGNSYVSSNVREIQNPANRNPTWDKGLWVEFTAYFDKRNAPDDYAAWQNLVNTIKNRYNYSVGGTELYINEYQLPWACYENDCHKFANCTETSPTSYTCICFKDYVDLDRTRPGR